MMYIQKSLCGDHVNCSNDYLSIAVISNISVNGRMNEDKISNHNELIFCENLYEPAVNCVLLI